MLTILPNVRTMCPVTTVVCGHVCMCCHCCCGCHLQPWVLPPLYMSSAAMPVAATAMGVNCGHVVMTVCLGLSYFLSPTLLPPLSFLLYYGHPPFTPCNSLELDLPSDTKARTRCLVDCAPSPLSITCLTLALTVLPTHASVPADVHPLCPFCARISSPLPYVSLHRLCMLPDPLTCVTPRPLYAL